jgi:hypothetical protein
MQDDDSEALKLRCGSSPPRLVTFYVHHLLQRFITPSSSIPEPFTPTHYLASNMGINPDSPIRIGFPWERVLRRYGFGPRTHGKLTVFWPSSLRFHA